MLRTHCQFDFGVKFIVSSVILIPLFLESQLFMADGFELKDVLIVDLKLLGTMDMVCLIVSACC